MAQVQRTTTGIKTVSAASLQNLINTLTTNQAQGKSITASDLNQLVSLYNSWTTHTHKADDLRGRDTFGDLATYGGGGTWASDPTSSAAKNTSGVLFPAIGLFVSVDENVFSSHVNTLISVINNIRNHKHTIFDTTS